MKKIYSYSSFLNMTTSSELVISAFRKICRTEGTYGRSEKEGVGLKTELVVLFKVYLHRRIHFIETPHYLSVR